MSRSVAIYRDVLGIPLKFESREWTEFATDGATLALHKGDDTTPQEGEWQTYFMGLCRPGLSVPHLDEFHNRMVDNHVICIQEPHLIFGARVAQYEDPDGLVIHVGEENAREKHQTP